MEPQKGRKKQRNNKKRKPGILKRIQISLFCGSSQSYDLVKAEKRLHSQVTDLTPKHKPAISLRFSEDELFHITLYREGLLKRKVSIKTYVYEDCKFIRISLKHKYPVLNICRGFYDHEMITGRPARGTVGSTADFRYGPTEDPNPWVQTGLDKVMYEVRSHRKEMRFRGLRVSTWLDILEPALPSLLLIRKMGRLKRSNISKCKIPSPLHRSRRVIIGDANNQFIVGPQFAQDQDPGFIAMFADRLVELSRRRWRREIRFLPQYDRNIGNLWEVRVSTRNRDRDKDRDPYTKIRHVNVRRSKSLSCIDIDYSRIPESTNRPPVDPFFTRPRERTRFQIINDNVVF